MRLKQYLFRFLSFTCALSSTRQFLMLIFLNIIFLIYRQCHPVQRYTEKRGLSVANGQTNLSNYKIICIALEDFKKFFKYLELKSGHG